MRRQSENESERAPSLRRRAVLWGAPVALLALAAGLFVRRPIAVRTSLDDLVGDGVEAIPAAVRAASADLVPVLVGPADDVAQAVAAARAIQARLPSDKLVPTAENPLAALATNRYGLAALDDVRLLETSEGRARVAQKALKKFYASPLPPLFPVAEDPFALADGFVRAQMAARANWNVRDGLLTAADGHGATSVVLPLRLRPEIAADADALIVFRAELNAVLSAVRGVPVRLGRRLWRPPAHGRHGGQLQAGDQCAQHFLVRLHRAPVGLRVQQRPLDSAPRRVARGRRARRGRRAPGAVLRDPPDDGRLRHDGDGPRD